MKRIYGIDGLRAIAVLFTVIQHYIISYYFRSESILGSLGVSIFFVISGFLITSILLKQKQENVSNKEKFIKFYTRRSLRIFPIYYLTISICILSGLYWFRNINPFWYYGYAINIFIAIQNNGWIGYAGHLWSLAVEEQFYLVWPMIILLCNYRYIKNIIFIFIFIGFLLPFIQPMTHLEGISLYVLPFVHLVALGIGALLAYCHDRNTKLLQSINLHLFSVYMFLISVFIFVCLTFYINKINSTINALLPLFVDLCIIAVIHEMWAGRVTCFVKIMEFYPIRIIGKASYGIYLFHPLVPELFVGSSFSPVTISYVNILIYIVTTLIIATISWKVIEKPCNLIKNQATNFVLQFFHI